MPATLAEGGTMERTITNPSANQLNLHPRRGHAWRDVGVIASLLAFVAAFMGAIR
jgi:hypothetical protein